MGRRLKDSFFFSGMLVGVGQLSPHWTFICVPIGLSWFLWQFSSTTHPYKATWSFGFGYLFISLYWICMALTVDLPRYFWLIPIFLLAIPAFFSLYLPLAHKILPFKNTKNIFYVIRMTVWWTVFELLHSYLLTGFPWALLGYSLAFVDALNQSVFYITIFGWGACVFLLASLPYVWTIDSLKQKIFYTLSITSVFLGFYVLGNHKLDSALPKSLPKMRLVQPNISQADKLDPNRAFSATQRLFDLSTYTPLPAGSLIIWPETSFPYSLQKSLQAIKKIVPPKGFLLAGATRKEKEKTFNSLFVIDENGMIVSIYDKVQLLAFGEYIPFERHLLKVFRNIQTLGGGYGFTPGKKRDVINLPQTSFLPFICYEIAFPNARESHQKPQWLLTISNDAWYHDTAGPYQHLMAARFRAIEESLPLIRVANNGISAVINEFGQVLHELPYGVSGIIDF